MVNTDATSSKVIRKYTSKVKKCLHLKFTFFEALVLKKHEMWKNIFKNVSDIVICSYSLKTSNRGILKETIVYLLKD